MSRRAFEHEATDTAAATSADTSVDVSAVIPCLNEDKTIGICIQKAYRSFEALGVRGEVIVADNGSVDRSIAVSESLNARVVREHRKGYGAALSAGINAARGKVIVIGDADDSYDWSDIAPFVSKVGEGYDLVMGNRFRGGIEQGAMPPLHRYLGNPVLSWLGRLAFHTNIGDFHCGMRAFTKTSFQRMGLTCTGMEFATEMVASAAYLGLRIAEIPTKLYPDKRDRAPHLRSFRDGWRHLRFILTYAPNHLYLVPGLGMLLLGILLQCLLVKGPADVGGLSLGIHFLALGSLLTLLGFNIVNMGVLAKTLVAHRYARAAGGMTEWFQRKFTLEIGLVAGLAFFVVGFGIDLGIAFAWLQNPSGSMESTVHLAFVATTAIVLGVNLSFSSFLIHMILLATKSRPNLR